MVKSIRPWAQAASWLNQGVHGGRNTAFAAVAFRRRSRRQCASPQDKKTLALVTNASADFWTFAGAASRRRPGAAQLQRRDCTCSEATAAGQRQILDDLLTKGVAGVSISAIDPANSTEILNKVASQAVLFTTDSDAAEEQARVYIGTDNVAAGGSAAN